MSLGPAFYRGADAVILVYDVNTTKTFDDLDTWRRDFLTTTAQGPSTTTGAFPFVVLGNKIDVDAGASRQVDNATVSSWCEARGGLVRYEVSAKDDTNVEEAFVTVARLALQHKQATTARMGVGGGVTYGPSGGGTTGNIAVSATPPPRGGVGAGAGCCA